MKFKKILALALALIMLVSLCSCGKMTAEKLIADMAKALVKADSFSGTMYTGFEMGMSVMGIELSMAASADMDISSSGNVSHAKGTMSTVVMGNELPVKTESYTVIDGGSVTSYFLTDEVWRKSEIETPEMNFSLGTVLPLINPENMGSVVLKDSLDTHNGREVYVLTIADCNYPELASQYISSQLGSVFGSLEIPKLDLSDVVMQITLKVYKDTKLPAVLTIDFGDTLTSVMEEVTDVLSDMIRESISSGSGGFDFSFLLGSIKIDVEIPAAMTNITFDEYDIAPIVIPDEVLNAKSANTESSGIFEEIFKNIA